MEQLNSIKKSSILLSVVCLFVLIVGIGCGSEEPNKPDEPAVSTDGTTDPANGSPEPATVDDEADPTSNGDDAVVDEPKVDDPVVDDPEVEVATFTRTKDFFALMDRSCAMCHSDALTMGELVLDSYAGIMAGGLSGPAVVAGSPDKSNLVSRLTADVPLLMPTTGALSQDEIDLIRAWVTAGAPEK